MRITIILALSILLPFFSCPNVLAIDYDIGYSKIHPASSFYFLKTVRENLELKFAQTTRVKNLRRLEFATRRLRETVTLVNINKEDLIPPTLERYISHLNSLTDKHQENDQFAGVLKNNLSIHLQVLEQLYHNTSNIRSKMAIRSAMNRIIQRADVPILAKAPICRLFASEASSSTLFSGGTQSNGLSQTEKVVLLKRAQKCQSSSK